MCNKQIAFELFIGEATMKSQVKMVFARLNALGRTQAVTTGPELGLIELQLASLL